jgi:hypothetical protein
VYERQRERVARRQSDQSRAARDIGPIPKVVNPTRKAAAGKSLRVFAETYFPDLFTLAWSDDHLTVITTIMRVVLEGGLFAFAMPRGSGKTTLIEVAMLWAVLYGFRLFGVIIGPDGEHGERVLETIKLRLTTNDLLLEDFPEVVYPIRRLEGITQRSVGQLHLGKPTRIQWTADRIVLPTIPGSAASGAVIAVKGITAGVRGMKVERSDGSSARPDLVLIDDPQTDESARSPSQCAYRESIINGAVLGLAGPGKKIAALATVTVVAKEDLADRLLDRKRYPQWQGRRMRMLYSLPTDTALWAEYAKVREQSLQEHGDIRDATAFYVMNRETMDAGAVVAWQARFNADEASAIQHAMNWKIGSPDAFWAECQNDPEAGRASTENDELKADVLASRLSRIDRGVIPHDATHLTAFVDIQKHALYWLVAAWSDDFTGSVVDYGTEPDQAVGYFTYREVRRTLGEAAPGTGFEGAIFAGLERLATYLLAREWKRDGDGGVVRVERCLIDANWGPGSEVVYKFCRQSPHATIISPSHGKFYGATATPISAFRPRPGERKGLNWYMPASIGRRSIRHVVFDTNWWKTFVETRLTTAQGDPGALILPGAEAQAHRLLADHLTSERPTATASKGRETNEWKLKQAGRDNHWWDCLVGSAVAASMVGVAPPGGRIEPRTVARVSFAEMQSRAAARRGVA